MPVTSVVSAEDIALLRELFAKNSAAKRCISKAGLVCHNCELAPYMHADYTAESIATLEKYLDLQGVLEVPIVKASRSVWVVTALGAADPSNHGEMSWMIYLRDHVQAASALMNLYLREPRRYAREGELARKLLLSALYLMSTPAQLRRFEDVIVKGARATQADWPHISLLRDDLHARRPNGWRNKQDSFQMLAYLTLEAIERKFIAPADLTKANQRFLGLIVPLLRAVGFPKYESSGSWEEVAAHRTSVMAIEVALINKLRAAASTKYFGFLVKEFGKSSNEDFTAATEKMLHDGLHEIGRRLPFESPDYPPDSVKYRTADAALAYVLLYDVPQLLDAARVPIGAKAQAMSAREIEALVLAQLETLADPHHGGMRRYFGDSYQRANFHTNNVQQIIHSIKRQVQDEAAARRDEVDLDRKQFLRNELTPQGPAALWTHPLGQLSAWAAQRSLAEADSELARKYRQLSAQYLNRQLALVTGENCWNAALDADGLYRVQPVAPNKLPECYVASELDSKILWLPSPHTPLNWSSVMMRQAVGLLRMSVERLEHTTEPLHSVLP